MITGTPGSGRSRLLTGFLMLCDPEYRKLIDTDALQPDTVPAEGLPVPPVFVAAELTPAQLLWLVADELGIDADRTEDVYALLAEPQELPVPVVVADVDRSGVLREPDGPARAAQEVLLPLALAPGIRLLTDVPRAQAEWLAERLPAEDLLVIDLDEEPWADADALRLQAAVMVDLPDAAEAIARNADGPLVVELAAWSLLAVPDGPAVGFPTTVGDALDLHAERCGTDELTLRRLLAPLALAGAGASLPFSLWEPLASAVAGKDLASAFADGQALLLPFFDLLDGDDDADGSEPAVRLRHPALADELRERFGTTVRESSRRMANALLARLPEGPGRWSGASAYARTGLIRHALEGGVLVELMADPAFLVHADQVVLRAAAEHLAGTGAELPAVGRTWLRLAPLFTRTQADPRTVAGLLEHGCRLDGLSVSEFGVDLPWHTLWHRPLVGIAGITAAAGPDGTPAVVANLPGGEQPLVAHHAQTGEPLDGDPAQLVRPSDEDRGTCALRLSVGGDYLRIWQAEGGQLAVFAATAPLAGADVTPDGIVLVADSAGLSALRVQIPGS
ncbi:ATP-binding protein [Kitasatospora sp. DSM 101779]|uniref:ATP-binding protein n=1 Tax=Kitasatospora sp. DSM 101779 TaxID=2853165 RepID=UPI0021D9E9E0|nr:ATP-binding protein [Kitasatospora sp. DSM 101779]MCU7825278.1 ATP-binding protein [Kitasatospora sp. DSM 101779]